MTSRYTLSREDVELEQALKEAKKRASDLSRDLDASRRETKAARDEAALVGPLKETIAEQKAEIAGLLKGLAAAKKTAAAAELKLKQKPAEWHAALEEAVAGGMKFDREDLQAALSDGWHLSHFCDGSGGRREWYSAARSDSSAMQSAGSQELLIQRCESWNASQPAPVVAAPRPAAEKAKKPVARRGVVAA